MNIADDITRIRSDLDTEERRLEGLIEQVIVAWQLKTGLQLRSITLTGYGPVLPNGQQKPIIKVASKLPEAIP